MNLLAIIFMLIIATLITFGFFILAKGKIKYSLILIFVSIFTVNYIYGLLGVAIAAMFVFPYILWCNKLKKNNFRKTPLYITLALAISYTCIQTLSLVLKVFLEKGAHEIMFKGSVVLIGIFFIVSLFELKNINDISNNEEEPSE